MTPQQVAQEQAQLDAIAAERAALLARLGLKPRHRWSIAEIRRLSAWDYLLERRGNAA